MQILQMLCYFFRYGGLRCTDTGVGSLTSKPSADLLGRSVICDTTRGPPPVRRPLRQQAGQARPGEQKRWSVKASSEQASRSRQGGLTTRTAYLREWAEHCCKYHVESISGRMSTIDGGSRLLKHVEHSSKLVKTWLDMNTIVTV